MKYVLICLFFVIASGAAIAQSESQLCADPLDDFKLNTTVQRGGQHMTSIGHVRALLYLSNSGMRIEPQKVLSGH